LRDHPPSLFGKERLVEALKVSEPQASLLLSLAHPFPANPMQFLLVICVSPPEIEGNGAQLFAQLLRQHKTTHSIGRNDLQN
jgi:hypothetical protein